jgi:hypothetical protein
MLVLQAGTMETESDAQRALKAALAVLDDSIKRRQDEI